MNKSAAIIALTLTALATACTDDTSSVGTDVMPSGDQITTTSQTYQISTTTVQVDSVLANTSNSQIGSIIDPEMRVRTTCDFLAQFHVPDNFALPKSDIIYRNADGQPEADSCVVRIYFSQYYGDSLATMKLQVRELDKDRIMEESKYYYTNLNPLEYLRTDGQGVNKSLTYAVKDLTVGEDQNNGTRYYRSIAVKLPTDYGTQLLRHYYDRPQDFANSYEFIHHVCPGFYFQSAGGVGTMITAEMMCLDLYFRYHSTTTAGADTIVDGMQRMGATAEVLQNTRITNEYPDQVSLPELQAQPCTYVKTPAGLFTEATVPVSDIVGGEHYNDSINQVKLVLRRYNSTSQSAYKLPKPQYLLLIRKNRMKDFFEQDKLADNRESYLTEYSETNNVYQFSNIASLVSLLRDERDRAAGVTHTDTEAQRLQKYAAWEALPENADWNKVYILPVDAEYATITTTLGNQKKLMRIQNNHSLSSTRIEGGNGHPIDISVIYGRFNR